MLTDPTGEVALNVLGAVIGGVTAYTATRLSDPGASTTTLVRRTVAGAVGGALLNPLLGKAFVAAAGNVAGTLAAGGATGFIIDTTVQGLEKGPADINLTESLVATGAAAVFSIPNAGVAVARSRIGASSFRQGAEAGLEVISAPKAVGFDLGVEALTGLLPEFTTGDLARRVVDLVKPSPPPISTLVK